MHVRPYQKLIAWKEAHALCLAIYKLTDAFPVQEKFRLVSQMCRAAYGIPMHLAEGNMKRSKKEKARFFEISIGSLEELHYQCTLSKDLKYIQDTDFMKLDEHMQRVSYFITNLRASIL